MENKQKSTNGKADGGVFPQVTPTSKRRGLLSRVLNRKCYGLFYREKAKSTSHALSITKDPNAHMAEMFDRPVSQYEIDLYFGELDPNRTWWLQETDARGRPKGDPVWVVRRHRAFVERENNEKSVFERLAKVADEAVEPLQNTFEALRKLDEMLYLFYPRKTVASTSNDLIQADKVFALQSKVYEEAVKAFGSAMINMWSAMASSMSNVSFPWQALPDFPIRRQSMAYSSMEYEIDVIPWAIVYGIIQNVTEGIAR